MIEKGNNFTEPAGVITYTKDNTYRRYEYDLLNRLVGVYSWDTEANGGTGAERLEKSYIYNAQGLRIEAIRNGLSTIYTFDQQGQMAQRDQEVTDNNFETRNYHYLGSKIIAHTDDPNTAQEETLYYGTDLLGSTTLITDAAGAEVWSGSVTPFADQESASDTSERVLFTGKELDQDTDLYYFNARWYDPELGRFTTEDPIRDGANWYVYVNNNPLRFVDPSGLMDVESDDLEDDTEVSDINNYTYERNYFDKDTQTMRSEREPGGEIVEHLDLPEINDPLGDAIDDYNDFMSEHGSITFRLGGVSTVSATIDSEGVDGDLGAMLYYGTSLTLDMNFEIPFMPTLANGDITGGFSAALAKIYGVIDLVGGMDINWNEEGMFLSVSAGLGAGYKAEAHFQTKIERNDILPNQVRE